MTELFLLAQSVGYSLIDWLLFAVVLAGIIGIVFIVVRAAGVTIPQWVISVMWVVLAVVVGVVAIKFLASLL